LEKVPVNREEKERLNMLREVGAGLSFCPTAGQLPPNSGTLNDTLGPEAAATGRKSIAKTILFIGFREITAATGRAGREAKGLYLLAIGHIFII
jgi:hypothetical protein